MTIAYLRVSTDKQETENQKFEIERFSKERNLVVDEWISDVVSGGKLADERKLGEIIRRLSKGDRLIVTEFSRLGRDWFDVIKTTNEFIGKGVILNCVKESFELKDDAMSRMVISMFATFAQEERRKISERIKMALDRKRAEYEARGERFPIGRPKGRYTIRPKHIRILKEAGYELKEIASDHLLCHVNHVSRIWNKLQKGQLEYE